MSLLLEFFTFALPKAGGTIGGIGITVSLLLFFLFILHKPLQIMVSLWSWGKDVFIVYFLFVFISLLIVVKNVFEHTLILFNIAQLFIILVSPLALTIPQTVHENKQFGIVNWSAIVVGGYAILQRLLGITSISLTGVTYTMGASLEDKPIGFSKESETISNKMPSTYQNGNGMGIFLALAILLLVVWPTKSQRQFRFKIIGIIVATIGISLSGSRSILFPLMLLLVLLAIFHSVPKTHYVQKKKLLVLLAILAVLFLVVVPWLIKNWQNIIQSKLYDRYVLQTIQNPSSDRGGTWVRMLTYIGSLRGTELLEFIVFGTPNGSFNGEGIIALLVEYGPLVTFSFFYLLLRMWIHVWRREGEHLFSYSLLAVTFAFLIDQSFYYPPSVMNYFMMAGIALQVFSRREVLKMKNAKFSNQFALPVKISTNHVRNELSQKSVQ